MRVVPHSFFNRATLRVAEELIGKYLVREISDPTSPGLRGARKIIREKIVETEAYVGEHDLACHTSRGKTERNKVMFESAGTIYIYFTYGMHWMLNIVTEKKGCGTAVLIRGTENISGPARLTKALKIDKSLNGLKLGKKSGLWIEDAERNKRQETRNKIIRLPRVGVSYAKNGWAEKPYRFVLEDNFPLGRHNLRKT